MHIYNSRFEAVVSTKRSPIIEYYIFRSEILCFFFIYCFENFKFFNCAKYLNQIEFYRVCACILLFPNGSSETRKRLRT